jgi:hypothetical protein
MTKSKRCVSNGKEACNGNKCALDKNKLLLWNLKPKQACKKKNETKEKLFNGHGGRSQALPSDACRHI